MSVMLSAWHHGQQKLDTSISRGAKSFLRIVHYMHGLQLPWETTGRSGLWGVNVFILICWFVGQLLRYVYYYPCTGCMPYGASKSG